ncbi:hypothetical protein PG994_002120 [Apiospora phragmitis]|uniref:Uncharacterized protein n=1 Tax=Apiospora phragmitis TaxID=2905665 RepID=A0ABR1WVI2_9PEZI
MDPMDPDEWDEDTAAMAQAMGFASFGGQNHPSKRRKCNARADDAFVAGAGDESTLPFHDAGSGSNNTPLGSRRQPAKKQKKDQKTNANEIDLDDDDDDEGEDNADGGNNAAEDPAPQYIDTSQPPHLAQSDIDAIVGAGGAAGLPAKPVDSGAPWWNDYYDPAFNTNPWEKIEKAQGMEPRGTWLSYDESKMKWAAIKNESSSSAAAAEAVIAQAA